VALICLGLLAAASQAERTRSPHTTRPPHPRPLGLVPDRGTRPRRGAAGSGPVAHASRIDYLGGPVLHSSRMYVIFWQPQGSGLTFPPGYMALVSQFMTDVAADSHLTTNEFALTGEYRDVHGPAAYSTVYAGSFVDNGALPPNDCTEPATTGPGWQVCLSDGQIQFEITNDVSHYHLPGGSNTIYFLLTPDGIGSCQDSTSTSCALGGPSSGYCGYHSSTSSGLLYAVVPYNAVPGHCLSGEPQPNSNSADPTLSTIGHEQVETVTDPYGNGWSSPTGNEIADACLSAYGPAIGGSGSGAWNQVIGGHHYWLQEAFSRLADRCEQRPRADSVAIAGARRWAVGQAALFVGHARQPGGSVRFYNWSFGDGWAGGGAAVTHIYARPGSYHLLLRITDSAGNWAYASRTVIVTRARSRGPRQHGP
jgi:hypothetical protein